MSFVNIIGICGKKFHGKDTIADYLIQRYGFTKVSLADPLKKGVQEIFGLTDNQLWGNSKEEVDPYWGISPREILQVVGTECFRKTFGENFPHIGENFWTMALERKIERLIKNGIENIVIADIRFPNERDLIKKYNGVLFRVDREILSDDHHVSECMDLQPDFIIKNKTFEQLYEDIDFLMSKLYIISSYDI